MCELIYIQRIDEGRTAGLKLTMGHHPYEAESTMRAPLFANLGSRYAELGKGAWHTHAPESVQYIRPPGVGVML